MTTYQRTTATFSGATAAEAKHENTLRMDKEQLHLCLQDGLRLWRSRHLQMLREPELYHMTSTKYNVFWINRPSPVSGYFWCRVDGYLTWLWMLPSYVLSVRSVGSIILPLVFIFKIISIALSPHIVNIILNRTLTPISVCHIAMLAEVYSCVNMKNDFIGLQIARLFYPG